MQGFDLGGFAAVVASEAGSGRTAAHAIPPIYVKTMLEEQGVGVESICEQFCAAVEAYCSGRINYKNLRDIIGSKHVIKRGCCVPHADLLVDLAVQGIIV